MNLNSMSDLVSLQLKRALEPALTNMSIDWGLLYIYICVC